MKKLLIIGASGHGKVVADIAIKDGYEEIVFLDDNESIKICLGYPVIGKTNEVNQYSKYEFFVAIGDPRIREKIQSQLISKGMKIAILIHPKAIIASNVVLGQGTVVMAGTVINSESKIGQGCIINTGATIDHDNILEDYVHVSVGSHLAGSVKVQTRTWIGIGALVNNNVTICSDCMIGAGAVVVKNIEKSGKYIGIPARRMINKN